MLELKDVSVIFNQGTSLEKRALDGVSVHIPEGQFVTVLGSNGAGKSTFFNVITGAAPAAAGTILLDGQDITAQKEHVRSRSIGRLFQNPEHGTAPHLTVGKRIWHWLIPAAAVPSPEPSGKKSRRCSGRS